MRRGSTGARLRPHPSLRNLLEADRHFRQLILDRRDLPAKLMEPAILFCLPRLELLHGVGELIERAVHRLGDHPWKRGRQLLLNFGPHHPHELRSVERGVLFNANVDVVAGCLILNGHLLRVEGVLGCAWCGAQQSPVGRGPYSPQRFQGSTHEAETLHTSGV